MSYKIDRTTVHPHESFLSAAKIFRRARIKELSLFLLACGALIACSSSTGSTISEPQSLTSGTHEVHQKSVLPSSTSATTTLYLDEHSLAALRDALASPGSLTVTRLAPRPENETTTEASGELKDHELTQRVFTFMPLGSELQDTTQVIEEDQPPSPQAIINLDTGVISIASSPHDQRDISRTEVRIINAAEIPPGSYTVMHTQQDPAWHASDAYYTRRNLPLPPVGDRARYLRGALGTLAVYLTKDVAIHTSPVWCDEVGGIQVSQEDADILATALPLGSSIVISPDLEDSLLTVPAESSSDASWYEDLANSALLPFTYFWSE